MFSPTSTNVTVMFPSGAGVEVRQTEETMMTTVLLPEEFKNTSLGLLGNMNGDAKDDLVFKDGQLVQNISNPEEIFRFGASCKKSLDYILVFKTFTQKFKQKQSLIQHLLTATILAMF